ncbi:MAG: hypothetical protein JNK05_36150 [Myxococcales bacterium]|nr:hypothetical protein [Myxococcales bacterium]
MTDTIATINAALAQPPGSTQVLDEALRLFFSSGYSYYRDRALLDHPSIQDPTPWLGERRILEHLAGGRWTGAFLRCAIEYIYSTGLLVRGFVDAPIDELGAMLLRYSSYGIAVFDDRSGDDPAALLALRAQTEDPLLRRVLLCAAIASSSPVSDALIAELDDLGGVPSKLVRRAFIAMGVERASRWIARRIDALPGGQGADAARERYYALVVLFVALGAPLDRATNDQLLAAFEGLATSGYHGWHELGPYLARESADRASVARELAVRAASSEAALRDRWIEVMQTVLAAAVDRGESIDPWFDAHLDAAVAANGGGTTQPGFLRVLAAIGVERAEVVLDRAWPRYGQAYLPFVLLLPNFSAGYVQKLADALVAAREDKALLDAMVILPLSTLGTALIPALQRALAEIKPKKPFVTKLCKQLAPQDAAALSAWLEARPEPKKSKKK